MRPSGVGTKFSTAKRSICAQSSPQFRSFATSRKTRSAAGVAMGPGDTVLTVIPLPPSAFAKLTVVLTSAALAAAQSGPMGKGWVARSNELKSPCPVEATLGVIGGRWKGAVLFQLSSGTKRFGQLRKLLPNVTQRMLTLQLRELEQDGLVRRTVYAEVPPRVEYELTAWGESLRPIIDAMCAWGQRYRRRLDVKAKAG
jgi:DNA-binding HxlR family transcriptional regulator